MSVKLKNPGEAMHFTVGPAICGLTLRLLTECPHCLSLPPSTTTMRVTSIDHEKGAITITSEGNE